MSLAISPNLSGDLITKSRTIENKLSMALVLTRAVCPNSSFKLPNFKVNAQCLRPSTLVRHGLGAVDGGSQL